MKFICSEFTPGKCRQDRQEKNPCYISANYRPEGGGWKIHCNSIGKTVVLTRVLEEIDMKLQISEEEFKL